MGQLKVLYLFLDPHADPETHRAMIDTGDSQVLIVGVNAIEEGARIAKALVEDGVALIELCGAFGYNGAKRVYDEVGDKVPIGVVGPDVGRV